MELSLFFGTTLFYLIQSKIVNLIQSYSVPIYSSHESMQSKFSL